MTRKFLRPSVRLFERSDRGFVVLLLVPQLLILGALITSLTSSSSLLSEESSILRSRLNGQLIVDGAIYKEIFRRIEIADGHAFVAVDAAHSDLDAVNSVSLFAERESAKVSINARPGGILSRLLASLCLSSHDIESVRDALNDGPPRWRSLSDLQRKSGLSIEVARKLFPHLTVYGFHQRPDVSKASVPVIMATLGVGEREADKTLLSGPAVSDHVGVISLYGAMAGGQRYPSRTRFVVYFTGDIGNPYRILDVERHFETQEEIRLCPPKI